MAKSTRRKWAKEMQQMSFKGRKEWIQLTHKRFSTYGNEMLCYLTCLYWGAMSFRKKVTTFLMGREKENSIEIFNFGGSRVSTVDDLSNRSRHRNGQGGNFEPGPGWVCSSLVHTYEWHLNKFNLGLENVKFQPMVAYFPSETKKKLVAKKCVLIGKYTLCRFTTQGWISSSVFCMLVMCMDCSLGTSKLQDTIAWMSSDWSIMNDNSEKWRC